jgi:DNA-binding NarL/FixJ family response regulator
VTPDLHGLIEDGLPLSTRERRVAILIGQGASNKEIAESLGISELTVKKHVTNILRKLELHDRLQLGLCVARRPELFEIKSS